MNDLRELIRKPLGNLSNVSSNSPPTPTANLKMLIRVASETSETRRRSLFSSSLQNEEDSRAGKYTRKEKSLGLLCEKFLAHFPERITDGEGPEIQLDDLAKIMQTERRRIYDIVNVLEAIQMMTKVGKNLYRWHGKTHERLTLAWLQQLGQKLKLDERYAMVAREENEESSLIPICNPLSDSRSSYKENSDSQSSFSPYTPSPLERKTSLGVACQKFLMLFLVAPEPKVMNLEFAAKVIHAGGHSGGPLLDSMMKTRIRRLYDIANILQSLKLIQKITLTENRGGKRPAFTYTGPRLEGLILTKEMLVELPVTRQRDSLLTFGKNLLDIPDEDPKIKKRTSPEFIYDEDSHQKKIPRSDKPSASLLDLSTVCELERKRLQITSPLCGRFYPPNPSTPRDSHLPSKIQSSPLNLALRRHHSPLQGSRVFKLLNVPSNFRGASLRISLNASNYFKGSGNTGSQTCSNSYRPQTT